MVVMEKFLRHPMHLINVELRSSFAFSDFSDFWTPEVLGTDEMSLS